MPRLKSPGFAPRGAELSFSMDGVPCTALEGESIAAALIAADKKQFKRDRSGQPRGMSCGMGVCFECEVSVDGGAPVRACMTRAESGMRVCSTDYRKPLPPIEAAPEPRDEEITSEVLVVGAGPAGINAALFLDAAGVEVTLIDERADPGGQYFKPLGASQAFVAATPADTQYREGTELAHRLRRSGVRVLSSTSVWGVFRTPEGDFQASYLAPDTRGSLQCRRLILAAGAFESMPAVPGWTLPGVMSTGAAQGLARSYRVAAGREVLIAGNGPLNLQLACELLAGGARVVAVAESAPAPFSQRWTAGLGLMASDPALAWRGARYLATLKRHGVPVLYGHHIARASGEGRVEAATLARISKQGRLFADTEKRFKVDALCLGYALQPANELARSLGCRHVASAPGVLGPQRSADFETSIPGVYVVGDAGVLGGAHVAQAEGRVAAAAILSALRGGKIDVTADRSRLRRQRRFQKQLWSLYAAPIYLPAEDEALICRCESVSLGRVRSLLASGVQDFGSIKRCSRIGMGSCQGRYCQRQLATVVAEATGVTPGPDALFEARLPAKPVAVAQLAREQAEWQGYRSIDGPFSPPRAPGTRAAKNLEAEVLVIGAGIIGVSTALYLAEAGVDVLVIDRAPPFTQASGTNAGSLHGQLLSSDFSDPSAAASPAAQALRLQSLGIAEWQSLESRLGADFEMNLKGGLVVAATDEELAYLRRKVAVEESYGLDMELLDRDALREALPLVSPAMRGAALCRGEGKINPLKAGPTLVDAARAAGVRFETSCAVSALEPDGNAYRVASNSAQIRSPRVVNAAGGWAAGIASLLQATLPVRTAPQQMIVTEALEPAIPLLVAAAGRHLTLKQVANGNVIIGGGWPAGFDASRDRAVNLRDSLQGNLWVARHVIPALGKVRILRSWATVGVMIDGAPILGEYPGLPGFFNVVGANGYTLGPILGRITAGMILGKEPPLDLKPFLVDRFQ